MGDCVSEDGAGAVTERRTAADDGKCQRYETARSRQGGQVLWCVRRSSSWL